MAHFGSVFFFFFKCDSYFTFFPFISSQDADLSDLRAVLTASRFAVRSVRVAPLASNVTCLCGGGGGGGGNGGGDRLFANGSAAELHLVSSSLTSVDEDAFAGPAVRLHTLSIRDSPLLREVPRAAGKVRSLRRLILENDGISEIHPYTFFGDSRLSHVSLSGNRLALLAENTFLGLEDSLRELDLRENLFRVFPLSAVKILQKLQSLNLAGNSIRNVTSETFTRMESLKYLDLSRNAFSALPRDAFSSLPRVQV